MKLGEPLALSHIRACRLWARGDRDTGTGDMRLSLAHMVRGDESVLCSTAFFEGGEERLGFLYVLDR